MQLVADIGLKFLGFKPLFDVARTLVGWEDGVEDVVDLAVEDDEGTALEEGHSAGFERGEIEGLGEDEVLVGEDGERQVEALGGFALVVSGLGRESEEMVDAQGL